MTTTPPRRVRVTSARRGPTRPAATSLARDLDEQTGLGDVYLEGLMRAQFRLAAIVLGLAVASIGGLPVLLIAIPSVRRLTLLGIPFPWLVLGVLVYPVTWLLAGWYTRQAERVESDFRAALDHR